MFSALSSLIWGTEQEVPATETITNKTNIDEHLEVENEWIYIQPKEKHVSRKHKLRTHFDDAASTTSDASTNAGMEESWLVTPPQCFNDKLKRNRTEVGPMENLLIEHPSMSIYHGSQTNTETIEEEPSTKDEVVCVRRDTHKAVAGRLLSLEKRPPLKEMNAKSSSQRKQNSSKSIKRKNQVYVRQHATRKNKQYGRMTGKHTAMVAKRGGF